MVSCLDALANERPWAMKTKKKHFDTSSNNLLTDVEFMRINAERERIKKYQEITKGSAYTYYKILKRLSEESVKLTKEQMSNSRSNEDPQLKMKLALKDAKLKKLLNFITDFMKQVVENGSPFEKSHYFLILTQISQEEVLEPMVLSALRISAEELDVSEFEYVQFVHGVKDTQLQKIYLEARPKIFKEK